MKGKKLDLSISNLDTEEKPVYITFQISSVLNKLLSESAIRSNRKKRQEAALRLEDHLMRFRSISEKEYVVIRNKIEVE